GSRWRVCGVRRGGQRTSLLFINATATTEIYTLSLHDALPIYLLLPQRVIISGKSGPSIFLMASCMPTGPESNDSTIFLTMSSMRSEEHTSERQSPCNLVCRLLLEKKKKKKHANHIFNSSMLKF